MTDNLGKNAPTADTSLDRREFVRRAMLVTVGAAAVPLLAACDWAASPPVVPTPTGTAGSTGAISTPVALADSTSTPVPATEPPPTATATATRTLPPQETSAPTDTVPASATQEATATSTRPPAPTSTPQPAQVEAVPTPALATAPHAVALLATTDRATGVPAVLDMLGLEPGWLKGKHVALKANFNSADPPPGSTHLDTLKALLQRLQDWGAARITLLERSGMGDTGQVLQQRGVMSLAKQFGVNVVVLDDLAAGDWVKHQGAHWQRGFLFPRAVQEADAVVQTCCLKTHRFGGHFTMSLKNSVGLVAKFDPSDSYNYMAELHGSANQRLMIAEINTAYKPALILLDGVLAFVNGGPDQGKKVQAGVLMASRDRVAIDAVAVAMLRSLGTTAEVSRGAIFDQPQISHAAALGLGVSNPSAITLHPAEDAESRRVVSTLQHLLS